MPIAAEVILPIGLLFLSSGLVVNFIQALLYVSVRPFSKSMYRKINKLLSELLWLEIIWLFDWWSNVKVELYTDSKTFQLMGKEHALVICNHRRDIDWLIGYVIAQRSGCLGSTLAIIKKSSQYLPSGFQELNDYPQPFWLALFAEGTRFTQTKLVAAQEYVASSGLPIPRNVLIPRTKGFVTAVTHLRSFVLAIYNVTLAIPKTKIQPTVLNMLRGRLSVVHLHIERHLMEELLETSGGIAQWCRDAFVTKVVIVWTLFLTFMSIKFFEWCPFSCGEIVFCAIFLAFAIILMPVLIIFSQSECSNHRDIPSSGALKENLLHNEPVPV